ncbi:tRNA (adenosine(37)-N6)-threonylcarbamoyltransferase complex dimerization subunit type 1 TsaB [Hufsiella ginkgonis]|uniref:tRNA (Adenosine(37)-N6)-threonylcarbamoyltransferase complex dimerization subunit type 1 TsaB n=1 Tax=Hufsiella ginkgonis TaxID=2695274 RepID=A0A7K1XY57_9SPHI|nr:tRNA (adenosine(37)-N6)-threonylcarbamoyltransferase complex dimerization subunit type 1 TsaB [Hufsiella ginkgonis]MXV15931.1 tRNA (adenosine(37)-N6)-threonylcarbamoyltransferase complex dimerization subunit type 1 TsaB [Hufsiella ginkgonis]
MALILQIETATVACSVALAADGECIARKELAERNVHASHITLFIKEVVEAAGRSLHELDAVAVSMGPGSYTGLRIGVSTAKGLCFALDKPLIAINTLQSMVYGFAGSNPTAPGSLFCPMIDARRMEVYTALFESPVREVLPVQAMIVDGQAFAPFLENKQVYFFGDGASKCKQVLDHANAVVAETFVNSAADLSAPAFAKFNAGDFVDAAYFEPFYLKDFIAGKPAINP